jgi:hypothetical protein
MIAIVNKATQRPGTFKSAKDCPIQAKHYRRNEEGLVNEERVLAALCGMGKDVMESERSEDIRFDIDAYIDGVPISIKTQDAGVAYGHIYVELCTQITPFRAWEDHDLAFVTKVFPRGMRSFDPEQWGPAWYLTGTAQKYYISQNLGEQGRRVRIYSKATIAAYIRQKGFDRVCGLSAKVLQAQSFKNTVCGYMPVDAVPFEDEFLI